MSLIAVVAPLKYGSQAGVRALLAAGSPFDADLTRFLRREVFLSGDEAIFLFEGPGARKAVQQLLRELPAPRVADGWSRCLAGRPRIAEEV